MLSSKTAVSVILAALAFGWSGPAQAHPAPAGQCVFDKYEPVAVRPYMSENGIDLGSFSYLGGAQLFIPAREGLTKEWLAASIERVLASAHQATSEQPALCDSPRFTDVHVQVVSGGNGFWVQLIGRDNATSEALLKWAHTLKAETKENRQASR